MTDEIPTYGELMLPVLKAVQALGGSGTGREISAAVVEAEGFSEAMLAETYEGRDKSILLDRLDWARSYCKLGGVLESPRRGLFLVTDLGREIAAIPASEAVGQLQDVDRAVRRARRKTPKAPRRSPLTTKTSNRMTKTGHGAGVAQSTAQAVTGRVEHFVLYLLRAQGMELKRGPAAQATKGSMA